MHQIDKRQLVQCTLNMVVSFLFVTFRPAAGDILAAIPRGVCFATQTTKVVGQLMQAGRIRQQALPSITAGLLTCAKLLQLHQMRCRTV